MQEILALLRGSSSQSKIAKLAGCSQNYVSKVERGEAELDAPLCLAYSYAGKEQIRQLPVDTEHRQRLQKAVNIILTIFDEQSKPKHMSTGG